MEELIFDHQILRLSDDFYKKYPNPPYREILNKKERPYNCLLIQTAYDYFICIPYRTEIKHPYSYKFTESQRAKLHKSGLDYTKIAIVSKVNYIDDIPALVDKDEYNETMIHLTQITKEANAFVEDYIQHCKGNKILHPSEFKRRYLFSTLPYFHEELGIEA